MKKAVIIIPIYKKILSKSEQISLKRCREILGNYPIIFVAPDNFEADYIQNNEVVYFSADYFSNIKGYNTLMLSPDFYEKFLAYEYMLLYQLDAYVFKDELLKWCEKNLDYIGASWIHCHKNWWESLKYDLRAMKYMYKLAKKQNYASDLRLGYVSNKKVGNGGFSLRNIKKMIEIVKLYPDWIQKIIQSNIPEDIFFGVLVNLYQSKQIKIPTFKQGIQFAFEMYPSYTYKLNHSQLPFGCHDFDDWEPEFWKEHGIIVE